jgi:hypothetical protein
VIIWKTALWGPRAVLDRFTEYSVTIPSTSNAGKGIFKPLFGNES